MDKPLIISKAMARQLAVTAQRLAGPSSNSDAGGIMEVINRLGCLQLDPINVVARSHLLVYLQPTGAAGVETSSCKMIKEKNMCAILVVNLLKEK